MVLVAAPLASALDLAPLAPAAAPPAPTLLTLAHPLSGVERALLASAGVVVLREYAVAPVALALVPPLARDELPPFVVSARDVEPLEMHLEAETRLVRAAEAREDAGVTGAGVTIAVVDSGVDATHPDLAGRVVANLKLAGGRFVDSAADPTGHGTHVASIAAGDGSASDGALAGVAPGARVLGLDISGEFDTAAAIAAFDWLFLHHEEYGVRVVVCSWGRTARGERFDPDDALVKATDRLVREGLVVVFSASNHGPGASTLSLEAQNPSVITVGATDDAGLVAEFSSRGPALDRDGAPAAWIKPDVVAPGTRVLAARAETSAPDARALASLAEGDASALAYESRSGTSQAAPIVAGVVALMLAAEPGLAPSDVANALRESAIDLGERGPDADYGFGLVDAEDALRVARGLAPTRANPLVAGGEETYRSEGRFHAATSSAVATVPALVDSSMDGYATLDFPVKPGATRVTFEYRWRDAGGASFKVYLTDGVTTHGPWSASARENGWRVVRGMPPVDLAPGDWTLAARGSAALDVAFEARADVHLAPQPGLDAPLDPRYRLPDSELRGAERAAAWLQGALDEATVRYHVWSREANAFARERPMTTFAVAFLGAAGLVALIGVPVARRARDEERPAKED